MVVELRSYLEPWRAALQLGEQLQRDLAAVVRAPQLNQQLGTQLLSVFPGDDAEVMRRRGIGGRRREEKHAERAAIPLGRGAELGNRQRLLTCLPRAQRLHRDAEPRGGLVVGEVERTARPREEGGIDGRAMGGHDWGCRESAIHCPSEATSARKPEWATAAAHGPSAS